MSTNDKEMKKIIAEIVASFECALGIVAAAVAREGDPDKFSAALKQQINITESENNVPTLAIRLATSALGAVESVRLEKRHNDTHQPKH
jgi:hypothetical protein